MNEIRLPLFGALGTFLALPTAAGASHLDNPNLLSDSSFEGSLTFDGSPFTESWEGFSFSSSTSSFSAASPRSGAQSLEMTIPGAANLFAGAFQDVEFGASYEGSMAWFSGWHRLVGDSGGSEIRIEWRNSVSDVEVSRTQITPSPSGSGYEEFVLSDTVPAGADTARVAYAIQSFGGVTNQTVYLDDVNFNIEGVPEPNALLLGGLSVLGLIRRRRN